MRFLFILLLPVVAWGQSRASFFPVFKNGLVIEERVFERGITPPIERGLERLSETYRYVVNYQKLTRIESPVAYAVHQLSQYSTCSLTGTLPVQTNSHFEQLYVETRFKCVTPENYDPVAFRKNLQNQYCTRRKILSKAQEVICKELGLY